MSPKSEYLHDPLCFDYLINDTMLDIDAPGIGTLQISDQSLE